MDLEAGGREFEIIRGSVENLDTTPRKISNRYHILELFLP